MDCKATVKLGDFSRGGKTRGDNKAADHDLGSEEKYIPCGIVDEDTGQLYITLAVPIKPAISSWTPCRRGGTGAVR